jgi:hypothetical protein
VVLRARQAAEPLKGRVLGRRVLEQLSDLVTPETILRWYRELITKKYDGTDFMLDASPKILSVSYHTKF